MGVFIENAVKKSNGTITVKDRSSVNTVTEKKYKMILPVNLSSQEIGLGDIIAYNSDSIDAKNSLALKLKESAAVLSSSKKTEAFFVRKSLLALNTNYVDVIFLRDKNNELITDTVLRKILKKTIQESSSFYGIAMSPITVGNREGENGFYSLDNQFKELVDRYFYGFVVTTAYTPMHKIGSGLRNLCVTDQEFRKKTGFTIGALYGDEYKDINVSAVAITPDTILERMDDFLYNALVKKTETEDLLKVFEDGLSQVVKTISISIPVYKLSKLDLEEMNGNSSVPESFFSLKNQIKNTDSFKTNKIMVFEDTSKEIVQLIIPQDTDNFVMLSGSITHLNTAELFNRLISTENKEKIINSTISSESKYPSWDAVGRIVEDKRVGKNLDFLMENVVIDGNVFTNITKLVVGSNFRFELYKLISDQILGSTVLDSKTVDMITLSIKSKLSELVKSGIFSSETEMEVESYMDKNSATFKVKAKDSDESEDYKFFFSLN